MERGKGELLLEKANKAEGDGSILVRYQNADENSEIGLEPVLHYDSLYPPLNLKFYNQLSVDIFNPDQQSKSIRLAYAAGSVDAPLSFLPDKQVLQPALRWQRVPFDLSAISPESRSVIRRLVFLVEDRKGKGLLYFDNIRLLRPR